MNFPETSSPQRLDFDIYLSTSVQGQIAVRLASMAGASSQNFFEGTEKLLEVWFSGGSEGSDLRDVKQ